jgi:hypothetical protein
MVKNKYVILDMPWMWLLEDNIEMFWETPQKAFQKIFWKNITLSNSRNGDLILWTWKKRQSYLISK